jgi:hypothetical protein
MSEVTVLFSGKTYNTAKQVLTENQIVIGYGYGMSEERYVVYRVENRSDNFIYHLINLETRAFSQTDLPRPLSEKFGIGMYYNAETPEFMDAFEVLILYNEAEYKAKTEQEAGQKEQERRERLKIIGKERLQTLIPADTKAVIIAELHEDERDSMTDYYGYRTRRTVIWVFPTIQKTSFRKCANTQAIFRKRYI